MRPGARRRRRLGDDVFSSGYLLMIGVFADSVRVEGCNAMRVNFSV
jgi:hypothetical protein